MFNSTFKVGVIFVFTFLAFAVFKSEARPKYMSRYNADKSAKREYKNKCTICHIGRGGAENTYFGEDFADSGYRFTPGLKKKYPKYFK